MAIKLEVKIFIKYLASTRSVLSNILRKAFRKSKFWKNWLSLGVKDASLAIEEGEILSSWDYPVRVNPLWFAFSIA